MKALLTLGATSLAAAVLAVPGSAAERYLPGVTDFPSPSSSERYVPFVTDFPEAFPETAPARGEGQAITLDGVDAALAALGLAVGALAAASLPALRRRRRVSNA